MPSGSNRGFILLLIGYSYRNRGHREAFLLHSVRCIWVSHAMSVRTLISSIDHHVVVFIQVPYYVID